MLSFIIIVLALSLYFLSHHSPKSDLIIYGFSAILFLVAGVAGFSGLGDIPIGETITYTYTTIDNQTVVSEQTQNNIYSNSKFFNNVIPLITFLIGLYMLIVLALDKPRENGREKQS